jgi:GTPase Era involved in 16S rRNA processing
MNNKVKATKRVREKIFYLSSEIPSVLYVSVEEIRRDVSPSTLILTRNHNAQA